MKNITEQEIIQQVKQFAQIHNDFGFTITERNIERFADDLVKKLTKYCYFEGYKYEIRELDFDKQTVRLVVFDGDDFDFPEKKFKDVTFCGVDGF